MTTTVTSPIAPTVFGRLKQAVRRAIDHCAGIDGAGATAHRSRSTAGEWNSRALAVFPPLDCALALDEAALIKGARPEIAHAYAAELGGVFIQLPEFGTGDEALSAALAEATAEFGDVARRVVDAQRDGVTTGAEREAIASEAQEALVAVQRIILLAREGETMPNRTAK